MVNRSALVIPEQNVTYGIAVTLVLHPVISGGVRPYVEALVDPQVMVDPENVVEIVVVGVSAVGVVVYPVNGAGEVRQIVELGDSCAERVDPRRRNDVV